jgi:hypothetical protein
MSGALTVNLVPVASVTVTPASQPMTVGDHVTFVATPKDAAGNPLSGRATTWSSSDLTKASIDAVTGEAIALDSGFVSFTATVDGAQGIATSQIFLAPIGSVAFNPSSITATFLNPGNSDVLVTDPGGRPLPNRSCKLTSSDSTIAYVLLPLLGNGRTDSSGKIATTIGAVLFAQGSVTVTADCEGTKGTLSVSVP